MDFSPKTHTGLSSHAEFMSEVILKIIKKLFYPTAMIGYCVCPEVNHGMSRLVTPAGYAYKLFLIILVTGELTLLVLLKPFFMIFE